MNILIVDGGLQGLSCGCSLCENHRVSVVTDDLMLRKSCFFQKVYDDVGIDNESLFSIFEKGRFDILIPTSDMAVTFVSKNKPLIENKYKIKCAVPDYSQICRVENKSRFMDFCENNGIPHPRTIKIGTECIDKAASFVGFPALIKPDMSVGARGITRVDSQMELKEKCPDVIDKFGSCSLQELIENQDYYYNVMLYRDRKGRYLGHTILKILRMHPVSAGSSSFGITVENDELLNICKDCLDKLDWVGMADFDVLQRLDNDEYKIIEINPRVPASLKAAAVSGVNFPEIMVLDTLGFPVPQYRYESGRMLRFLGLDIMWFLKSPNRFSTLSEWLKFFRKNQFYQDIYACDFSTWWTWLIEGIGKLGTRNKKYR